MVDLDSDPTKLIEVIAIGKQLLITRGAITTFSHRQRRRQVLRDPAGDVRGGLPGAQRRSTSWAWRPPRARSCRRSSSTRSIIIALVPLSLRGVAYRAAPAAELLRRNLLIYGVGGIIAPFVGIKLIDVVVTSLHLA